MTQDNRRNLFEINIFSWILFSSYLFTFCYMTRFPIHSFSIENLFFSLPIVCGLLFWSQQSAHLLYLADKEINKTEALNRDMYIFNFCILISFFIAMIMDYKSIDTRALWSLLIYPFFLYGLIFSFCYALVLKIEKNHRLYTLASACLFLIFFPAIKYIVSMHIFINMSQLSGALYVSLGFIITVSLILIIKKIFTGKRTL